VNKNSKIPAQAGMGIDELERAADLLMGRTIAAFVTRVEDDGREVFVVICDDGTTLTCEHPIVEAPAPVESRPSACELNGVSAQVSAQAPAMAQALFALLNADHDCDMMGKSQEQVDAETLAVAALTAAGFMDADGVVVKSRRTAG
jgi:hypothetical protein